MKETYITIEEKDRELVEYFGEGEISVEELITGFIDLSREHEELKRKIDEDYYEKKVDYYEEYGLSESDFH